MTVPSTFSEIPSQGRGPELPVHLTPFIGRGRELADLVRMVGSVRLITLTGAGGSGKTRLAREAALRVHGGFEQVGWADLSPINDPAVLAQQAAAALHLRERPDVPPLELMIQLVGGRPVLLVLDNCEHLVDGCASLADRLLRSCPRLTILTTSREALGVPGETAWLVPPLARDEAAELFVERAKAAVPAFELTAANAPWVEEICRRLDGIPLAIELAAARVRVLSPEQIARRLDDAFRLLTGGSRTALPRHRTLRATMEWSFGLLSEREQVLMRRLAVFAGSFTLDAAEAICAGGRLELDDILDGVAALVDRSLIFMEGGEGGARYRALETVRQYGLEQLAEAGERGQLERRFAEHFLHMLEAAEPILIGGCTRPSVLEQLIVEMDNLRAAATWAVMDPSRAGLGLRFVGAAFWLCYARGMFREMRRVTDQALAVADTCQAHACGRALAASALTALAQGDYERACADFEAAMPLLREAADAQGFAVALAKQGAARLLGGDMDGAVARLEEALAYTDAWPEQDMAVIFARFWRGWAAYGSGDLEQAQELMAANLRVGVEHDLVTTRGHSLAALGRIALARGRVEEARILAFEGLDVELSVDDGWGIGLALDVIAAAAAQRGRPEVAVRLMAGVEAHRKRIALALPGPSPAELTALTGALRVTLGDRFEPLYREGLGLSIEETVRLARTEAPERASGSVPDGAPGVAARSTSGSHAGSHAASESAGPEASAVAEGAPRLQVLALGPLQIGIGGRPLEPSAWGSARPRELLVYLLVHPAGCTKEQVGLAFWPDASTSQLRNNFHVTLHRLRRALGGQGWVALVGERYVMDLDRVDFDAVEFEREIRAAKRLLARQTDGAARGLEAALARYRGDFLEGEPVGDWHLAHRDDLRRLYLEALMALGAHHAREERQERAVDAYRRVLARDELHEDALRALVRALIDMGERSQAFRVYQRFADRLKRELGAEPAKETRLLLEQLATATAP